jgi:hypothetical protein
MKKLNREIVSGSFITLVCILIYFFIIPTQIKLKANAALGPEFFPKIAVMVIGICALIFTIIQIYSLKDSKTSNNDSFSFSIKGYIKQIIFILFGFAFLIVVEYLGFPIASILLLIFLLFFFGSKGVVKNIVIAVIYGCCVYYLFSSILKISFPTGIFGI